MSSYTLLVAEMRQNGLKSAKNVDAMRRVLLDTVFAAVLPQGATATDAVPETTAKESGESKSLLMLGDYTSDKFEKRMRKWILLLGWSVQSHDAGAAPSDNHMDTDGDSTSKARTEAVMPMSKAWQCLEECFECLPLSEVAKWFEMLISEEWMQSGSEVKVPSAELGVPLRFFRALLLRLSYAASSTSPSASAQPHRFAAIAGLVLAYASSILPLCHASGLNRKSLINFSRKTPITIPDGTVIFPKAENVVQEGSSSSSTSNSTSRNEREARGSAQKTNSLFTASQAFVKASQLGRPSAAAQNTTSQSHSSHSRSRGTDATSSNAQKATSSLSKQTFDLLWDFVSKLSSLTSKVNDAKESPRINENLIAFDSSVQKVLQLLVNYEVSSRPSAFEPSSASSSPLSSTTGLDMTSDMSLCSLTRGAPPHNTVTSFTSSIAIQSSAFLTLPFATHLQLLHPTFRLQVVVHTLIFLHSLKRASTAPSPSAAANKAVPLSEKPLTPEATTTLDATIKKVETALAAILQKTLTPSNPFEQSGGASQARAGAPNCTSSTAYLICQAVLEFMTLESKYVDWKIAGCPDFELALPSKPSSQITDSSTGMDIDTAGESARLASKKRICPFWREKNENEETAPGVLRSKTLTSSSEPLQQSLSEFISASKKRREAPKKDGFVGYSANSAPSKPQTYQLGAPALNNLFNNKITIIGGRPTLSEAMGEIPTPASIWRAKRVVRAIDSFSAYNSLCLSSINRDGEPFDLPSFVSASNASYPSPMFVPPSPPTPPPEPEPIPEITTTTASDAATGDSNADAEASNDANSANTTENAMIEDNNDKDAANNSETCDAEEEMIAEVPDADISATAGAEATEGATDGVNSANNALAEEDELGDMVVDE